MRKKNSRTKSNAEEHENHIIADESDEDINNKKYTVLKYFTLNMEKIFKRCMKKKWLLCGNLNGICNEMFPWKAKT